MILNEAVIYKDSEGKQHLSVVVDIVNGQTPKGETFTSYDVFVYNYGKVVSGVQEGTDNNQLVSLH